MDYHQKYQSVNSGGFNSFLLKIDGLEVEVKELKIKTEPEDQIKPKRRRAPRFKDEKLLLVCEMGSCVERFHHWYNFQNHVQQHLSKLQVDLGQILHCEWRSCQYQDTDHTEMFRHVNFHSYHSKLKCHAKNILNSGHWTDIRSPCTTFPKKLPQLKRYMCAWADCSHQDYDWLQPLEFFNHVYSHQAIREEKYPCRWAGCTTQKKEFPSKFKEHLRRHTKEKLLACPTCGSLLVNRVKFYDHIRRQELQEASLSCDECGKVFPSQRIFTNHVRSHKKPFACNLCAQTCVSPSTLKMHLLYKHTQERPFSCEKLNCNFKGKTKEDIKSHNRSHEKNTLFCDSCDFSCSVKYTLRNHFKDHHSNISTIYACHICDYKARKGCKLGKHLGYHNIFFSRELSRFIYTLNLQTGMYQLREDMATSTQDTKPVKLEQTKEGFGDTNFSAVDVKNDLDETVLVDIIIDSKDNNEKDTEDKLIINNTESKEIYENNNLKENKEKTLQIRKIIDDQIEVIKDMHNTLGYLYKSKQCEKVNKNKNNLRIHMETHLEGVRYECLNCNFKYKTKVSWTVHLSKTCKKKSLGKRYKIHFLSDRLRVSGKCKGSGTLELFDYSMFMGSLGQ